jgi:ring-1,2-phenylacetyl-CoA epoxidase subunit PaaD
MVTTMSTALRLDPRTVAAAVVDPEIPVITIEDLGILRDVVLEGDRVVVTITPTYSGCPAMRQIRDDLITALGDAGYPHVEVRTVLSPAWTTDWMSDEGRRKLEAYGIAPPGRTGSGATVPVMGRMVGRLADIAAAEPSETRCPQCRSAATRTVSEFGSTACKALMVCGSCGEPFDRFKEH